MLTEQAYRECHGDAPLLPEIALKRLPSGIALKNALAAISDKSVNAVSAPAARRDYLERLRQQDRYASRDRP